VTSHSISVRLSNTLAALLRSRSRAEEQTASDLVSVALATYLGREFSSHSAYKLARKAGLIGCVRRAPKDLSTNRQHIESFEKNK